MKEKRKILKKGRKKGEPKKGVNRRGIKKIYRGFENLEKKVKDLNNQIALESRGCHTLKCCIKVII